MNPENVERKFAREVVQKLVEAGHQALWAGGCVRDEILGLTPADYDVATSARPEEVRKLFPKTISVGASFGVIEIIGPRLGGEKPIMIQVATFRADTGYSDGRRPDSVRFCDAREDALRRDFTINGMFYDPIHGQLVDYVDGKSDLENKILRAIGNPTERFAEDRLRMLRAVRLTARFDLKMDTATNAAIKQHAKAIHAVSAERIADELHKICLHPSREHGIRLFVESGLSSEIIPELALNPHEFWKETFGIFRHLPPDSSFALSWAVLVRGLSLKLVDQISERLKLSNLEHDLIHRLVENQESLAEPEELRLSVFKKILCQPWLDSLLAFMKAVRAYKGNSLSPVEYCLARISEWGISKINPQPFITGEDLKALGFLPGPQFKEILDHIRDEQLDERLQDRESALELAKSLAGTK